MKIESKELKDFIDATLSAIKEGIAGHKEFKVDGPVNFSLAVVNTLEKSGGLKIYVTNAGAKFKKEQVSKLEFKIGPVVTRTRKHRNKKAIKRKKKI